MAQMRNQLLPISFAAILMCSGNTSAQKQKITISEPATVKIQVLLKEADAVAVIQILSGDTEQYPTAVYKAEVLKSFKGTKDRATIFFGPYITYSLGGQYLVFLHRAEKGIEPKAAASTPGLRYGRIDVFYRVMYQGYGSMPIRYACVFDGKNVSQQCDYGIKVNTYQVALPRKVRTFPSRTSDISHSNDRWVRKTVLISLLGSLPK